MKCDSVCDICQKSFEKHKSMTNHRRWHDIPEFRAFQQKFREVMHNSRWDENNPNWNGNTASYKPIHTHIMRRLPKPSNCQECNKETPRLDLANISQQYKRSIDDWAWLCRRCHMIQDGRMAKWQAMNHGRASN